MRLTERFIDIPIGQGTDLIEHFDHQCRNLLRTNEVPIRFVVTRTTDSSYQCEVGIMEGADSDSLPEMNSIFKFSKREYRNDDSFNAVLLIPTGIGSEFGGHAGDGGPIARLLAGACDTLITHPNVLNASDINEIPDNTLYVEGSVISRLLMGTCGLRRVRANRILTAMDRRQDEQL